MSKDLVAVSLRIHHPTCFPTEISRAVQREPDHTGIKGEQRGHGRGPLTATWRDHYWSSEFSAGETPEARISAVAEFLTERKEQMLQLLRSGGRADVYVFVGKDGTVALELEPAVLVVLGQIGVTLGIEVLR